jgi:hypothetical protein
MVMNGGAISSLSHTSSWHKVIKYGDYFTVYAGGDFAVPLSHVRGVLPVVCKIIISDWNKREGHSI